MADNEASPSLSRVPMQPTITLPPRASIENFFMGGPTGVSPGPMTLVSSFFSDPDPEYPSFSQLLAGPMASPADFSGLRQGFPPPPETAESVSKEKETGGRGSGYIDNGFKQSRPSGLVITQSSMFTIPPGLSSARLLGSPLLFSPGQIQILVRVDPGRRGDLAELAGDIIGGAYVSSQLNEYWVVTAAMGGLPRERRKARRQREKKFTSKIFCFICENILKILKKFYFQYF